MSVSLYDLLDVEPDASAGEIRAAWKAAIADLGPGDRRFRAYNEAAEVLLDSTRRAAYDAELAGSRPATEDPEPTHPTVVQPEAEPELATDPEPEPDPEPGSDAEPGREPDPATDGRGPVATWLVAAVGLVAAVVLAVTIVVWLTTDLSDEEAAALDTEDNAAAALTAAEEAAVPVLSYDYRTFDEGVVDAESYMTADYRAEHNKLMSGIRDDAVAGKVVAQAEFKGSGIVRVTGDRADILVLVNQVVEKPGSEGLVLPVWATLQMVQEDGEWLVDKVINEGSIGT